MRFILPLLVLAVTAALSFMATRALLPVLKKRAILDHPNERSSHRTPTPRGGGIAVMAVLLIAWVAIGRYLGDRPLEVWLVPAAALFLALVSWLDDLKSLGPLTRLVAQAAAVALILRLLPDHGPFFQGLLPAALDPLAAAVLWLWFINLFNFMDGIDGITGVETLAIGVGLALITVMGGGENQAAAFYAAAAAGVALGFLKMNWHPAKIFMGDVGSVPLGFLLGWLLLGLAGNGQWAAALILASYYLSDATVTICRRIWRRQKIWRPHRSHFYQQAVQRGLSHGAVSLRVLLVNAALVVLAGLAVSGLQVVALAAAAALNVVFLSRLARGPRF